MARHRQRKYLDQLRRIGKQHISNPCSSFKLKSSTNSSVQLNNSRKIFSTIVPFFQLSLRRLIIYKIFSYFLDYFFCRSGFLKSFNSIQLSSLVGSIKHTPSSHFSPASSKFRVGVEIEVGKTWMRKKIQTIQWKSKILDMKHSQPK